MTLNPVLKISTQMIEWVQAHVSISKQGRARALPRDAGPRRIPSPDERLRRLSAPVLGGMRQRVAIAIALLRPRGDRGRRAHHLRSTSRSRRRSSPRCRSLPQAAARPLIWITHDLSVVSSLADNIAVMYAGRVVEQGRAATSCCGIRRHPVHQRADSPLDPQPHRRGSDLAQIPRHDAAAAGPAGQGCAFRPPAPMLPRPASPIRRRARCDPARSRAAFIPMLEPEAVE